MTSRSQTPLRAIRQRCMDCAGHAYSAVRDCDRTQCELWPYRMGHRPTEPAKLTALKSIRRYCVDNCCCGSEKETRLCPQGPSGPGTTCSLYLYRFGHNPKLRGIVRGASKTASAKTRDLGAAFPESSGKPDPEAILDPGENTSIAEGDV